MTLPITPKVEVRFGTGAGFGNVLVLGSATDGILGSNVLGTSSVAAVDVTAQVQQVSIQNGRDRVFNHYNSGTCVVQLLDTNGDWNPENPSSPYYPNILPMRQLRVSGTYLGNQYYLFSGYIQSIAYDYQPGLQAAIVTIQAVDAFRLLNLTSVSTIAGAAVGDSTGQRIEKILTAASWPSGMRNIDTGDVTMQADPGTLRSALNAIWACEDVELGAFYAEGSGNLRFKDQTTQKFEATINPTKFDDDGTDIPYKQLEVSLDDQDLANYVVVQREGGTEQIAQDSTSIATYFQRTYSRTGLLFENDTQALQQALTLLNIRKDVEVRVDSITLDCSGDSAQVLPAVSLEIGSAIQVARTQPGGSRIVVDLTVQGIRHDITPGTWTTTFSTTKTLGTAFILGSATFGILGTSTL